MSAHRPSGRLGKFDRKVLAKLNEARTAEQLAAEMVRSRLAVKSALGRLRKRGQVQDIGSRPPRFVRTEEGDAVLAIRDRQAAA